MPGRLPAAVEQRGEHPPALGRVEEVGLLDAYPRQRAAPARELVAQARQLLFARKERLALGGPSVPDTTGWSAATAAVLIVVTVFMAGSFAPKSPRGA